MAWCIFTGRFNGTGPCLGWSWIGDLNDLYSLPHFLFHLRNCNSNFQALELWNSLCFFSFCCDSHSQIYYKSYWLKLKSIPRIWTFLILPSTTPQCKHQLLSPETLHQFPPKSFTLLLNPCVRSAHSIQNVSVNWVQPHHLCSVHSPSTTNPCTIWVIPQLDWLHPLCGHHPLFSPSSHLETLLGGSCCLEQLPLDISLANISALLTVRLKYSLISKTFFVSTTVSSFPPFLAFTFLNTEFYFIFFIFLF